MSRTTHVLAVLFCFACPVTSVFNQTQFDNRPYIWSTADLLCSLSGSRLAIPKSADFRDISASLPNSQSAWVGGRLINWAHEWSEYSPQYEYSGCYTNEGVGPVVNGTFSNVEDPETCFRKCGSQVIGLKSSYCQCLRGPVWGIFRVPDDNCQVVCPASFGESCGGAATYSVYERATSFLYLATLTPEYSSKYEYWGCYTNEGIGPLVNGTVSDVEDPQTCFKKCGTQFIALKSSYCQCLKGPMWEVFHVPDDNCQVVCPASFGESCGGAVTYSVYESEEFPYIDDDDVPEGTTSRCGYLYSDGKPASPITFSYDVCDETVTQKRPVLCQSCTPDPTTCNARCLAQRFDIKFSWNEADVFCKNQGLTLATSTAENIQSMFPGSGSPESYWVGIASPTDLIWLDGSVVKADFYNPPLIVGDGECLALNKDQNGHVTMTREACTKAKPFLCGQKI